MKPEQITAWALDEASAEERQHLEAALQENPQDKQKADETKAFCDFLLNELRDDSLALTNKQRERLMEQARGGKSQSPEAGGTPALRPESGTPALQPPRKGETRWNMASIVRLGIAACAVLGGFWTWMVYSSKTHTEAPQAVAAAENPVVKVQLAQKTEVKKKAEEVRLLAAAPAKPAIVPQAPSAKPLSPPPAPQVVATSSTVALKQDQRAMTPADVERLKRVQDENAYGLNFGGAQPALLSPSSSLIVTTTGKTTRRVEPMVLGTSTMVMNGSGAGANAGSSMVQLSTGGGDVGATLELGTLVLNTAPGSLTMTPGAAALLRQTQARTAASLSLKAGFYPPQINFYQPTSSAMVVDGNINLQCAPPISGSYIMTFSTPHLFPTQKTGLVSCLLDGVLDMGWNGWLPMSQADPRVLASSVEPDMAGTLADYQPSMVFGNLRLNKAWFNNIGEAWLMLTAANASTGGITIEVGSPFMMSAFLNRRLMPDYRGLGMVFLGSDDFTTRSIGSVFYSHTPLDLYTNPNSAGVISFATAVNSQLSDAQDIGSFSAEDLHLLGGLLARDYLLSVNPAVLANASEVSEMQAAVFNVTALSKFSSNASATVGSVAVVMNGGAFNMNSMRERVDLMGSPTFTANAGTQFTTFIEGRPEFGNTAATSVSGVLGRNPQVVANVVSGAPLIKSDSVMLTKSDSVMLTLGDATNSTGGTAFSDGSSINKGSMSPAPAQTGTLVSASANANRPREGESMAAVVSSSGGLTQTGAGKMVLSGIRNYMAANRFIVGTTQVSNGAAIVSGGTIATAAGAPATMKRNAGATLDINGGTLATTTPAVPITQPLGVLGGWATTDGSELVTFRSTTLVGTNPPAAVAGPNTNSSTATPQTEVDKVQSGLLLANGSADIGNYDAAIAQYQTVLRTDPYNAAARRGMEEADRKKQAYFKTAYDHQRAKMLAQVTESWEDKVPVQASSRNVAPGKDVKTDDFYLVGKATPVEETPTSPSQPSTGESYTRIIENEMKDVAREPLSTLSIDVDTASYANVRRFLNQNMLPPPDAVRIEELVNYFPTLEEGPAHDAKEPFAVRVELAPCPWQPVHRLARISIKGREMDKDRKASNLVFLVDVSGSMNSPDKLPLVQQSLRMLTELLGEGDRVTMVVYAGSSGVVLPPTSGEKKAEILAAINNLSAGGSTHGSAGIKLAYEQAVAGFIKGGVNRVILCTDGDFNVGVSSPEELEKLIKHKAKTGVFLSVLGFGSGNLKDRTMETLADKGNGNYACIDSLSEARKVLVEQMSGTLDTIAKDVKIQVEFNPAAVRSYRLIGYENRVMAKEDFNDDTKDAGEIGAGHSVVALYEVVPANLPAGAEPRPAVDSLKYQAPAIAPAQLAEAAKSGEMMTVKLRYKAPDSDLSKLIEVPTKDAGKTLTASSEEFKFSAAVAGFGLLLRDSSYKGTLSWETVRRLALDGKGADKLGYRGEFLQLIDKARGLKETRP